MPDLHAPNHRPLRILVSGMIAADPQGSILHALWRRQRDASVEIPAGGAVELMPGGYHLMFIDLLKDLLAGDTFEVDLHFATAGMVTVTMQVMELAEGKANPPADAWTVGDITVSGAWSRPAPAMAADGMGGMDHQHGMDSTPEATPSM